MGEPQVVITEEETPRVYDFGEFEIATDERLLRHGEEVIHLPPKVIDLLLVLVASGGRVLAKEELMQRVWADSFVEETNLTHNISLLRRILGEKKTGQKFIETIPRRGYRFVAEVTQSRRENIELIAQERIITRVVTEEEMEISDSSVTGENILPATKKSFRYRNSAVAGLLFAVVVILGTSIYVWQSGNKKIALPFQRTSIKQLTNVGRVTHAALSPDGKLFAYSKLDNSGRESVWLGQVEGGREVELRPPAEKIYRTFSFSPDGNSLYYTENDNFVPGTLYKIPVLGGAPEKIREQIPRNSAFSPDQRRLAYVRRDAVNQRSVLCVIDLESQREQEIAARPAGQDFISTSLSWSPEGNQIALAATNETDNEKKEILVTDIANNSMRPLTNQAWKAVIATAWLKDGSGLMVVAAERGSLWFATQLWHVSSPNGEVRRITSDLSIYGFELNVSAGNRSLLAVAGQFHSNIWIAPADGLDKAAPITNESPGRASGREGLSWLPGGRIVYTAMTDRQIALWVMNSNGSGQRPLTSSGYTDQSPAVPAGGQFIIFNSDRGGRGFDIWRIDADGTHLRQLTFGAQSGQPGVSPDGKWVVYTGRQNGRNGLCRVPAEGGESVFLNENVITAPSFSPDSQTIAVGYQDRGQRKLALLSAEDGKLLKLFDVPRLHNFNGGIKWMPDGDAITYGDIVDGIWKQPLRGGEPQRLPGLPNERIYGYDWSPDKEFFAFTRGTENRDVVLIRNSSEE